MDLRRFHSVKTFAGLAALVTIIACGGDDGCGNSTQNPFDTRTFPLTSFIPITATNNDTDNIHIFITQEDFDPNINMVQPGQTQTRNSVSQFRWTSAQDSKEVTVFAGRGGIVFDSFKVNFTGADRQAGKRIRATWSADQNVTATVQ